ncbi:MAG: hypothetical protein LBL08_01190 [Candidatus Nomurabacteria bacterium]|jgi:hypothetical protein|nr:hypothetical protein [Candidatus Nomurabacteria bacterium]
MREASSLDKLLVSAINFVVAAIPTIPFFFIGYWQIALVSFFLIYQVATAFTKTGQSIGMRALKIRWAKKYPIKNRLIFAILYTASFATITVWVFSPFDLLIFNLLIIQLPMVLTTGYTLHGFLAGKMYGIKSA